MAAAAAVAAAAADAGPAVVPMDVDVNTHPTNHNHNLVYYISIKPTDPTENMIANEYQVWKSVFEQLNTTKLDPTKTYMNDDAIQKHKELKMPSIGNSYPKTVESILNLYMSVYTAEINGQEYNVCVQFYDFKNPQDVCAKMLETECLIGVKPVKFFQHIINRHVMITQCFADGFSKYIPYVMGEMIQDAEYKPSDLYNLTPLRLNTRLLTKLLP